MPLIGIPSLLSPDLLKYLAEMGHGDTLVLADAHFPSHGVARRAGCPVLRYDGVEMPSLLEAVLAVLPLDTYVDFPIAVMGLEPSDRERFHPHPPIWAEYARVHPHFTGLQKVRQLPRMDFYSAAEKAFCIVHTGELAQYANVILTKGLAL